MFRLCSDIDTASFGRGRGIGRGGGRGSLGRHSAPPGPPLGLLPPPPPPREVLHDGVGSEADDDDDETGYQTARSQPPDATAEINSGSGSGSGSDPLQSPSDHPQGAFEDGTDLLFLSQREGNRVDAFDARTGR